MSFGWAQGAVEVRADGSGVSIGWHDDGERFSQHTVWDKCVVFAAGPYAEARIRRRTGGFVLSTSSPLDQKTVMNGLDWLVDNGHAKNLFAAFHRMERKTNRFLDDYWTAIERVAEALRLRGRLEADQVRQLVFPPIQTSGKRKEPRHA